MLRLRRYDLKLEYVKGKLLIIADALLRANPPKVKSTTERDVEIQVHMVKETMPVADKMWKTLAQATEQDETLKRVKCNILHD